jgi:hypothetical protein
MKSEDMEQGLALKVTILPSLEQGIDLILKVEICIKVSCRSPSWFMMSTNLAAVSQRFLTLRAHNKVLELSLYAIHKKI